MTPQLQMAIKLLQLNRLELADRIQQELSENPALEEVTETDSQEESSENEAASGEAADEQEVYMSEKISDQVEWENYLNDYNAAGGVHFETEPREQPQYESFIAPKRSLNEHLLWQFLMTLPDETEENIASMIIGNVDEDGYLQADIPEIAAAAGVSPEKAETVLEVFKTFDPPGVCARNLSECLLLQLHHLDIKDPIVHQIIEHHLRDLENRNYKAIARALKISMEDTIAAVNVIQNLEPRPGREFKQTETNYIVPDIYVYKFDDDFMITLNDDDLPKLNINPYYKKTVNHNNQMAKKTKEYLQERIRSASWLIKSIQQRRKTIYNVMNSILKFQYDFFEKGVAHLKPMVLRDVAEDIGMHESTISRVTSNKYAHTPQGIFELKFFFNSSINRVEGESMASASVQEAIRQIIKSEDSTKPFSDDKISKMLADSNIDIARRTVTKYREAMGILSSTKRKQY